VKPTKQHILDELERLSKQERLALQLLIRKVRKDTNFVLDHDSWREDLVDSVADLADLRDQFGDITLAVVASHWGVANVEELVAVHGPNGWRRHLPRTEAEYLQAVMP
jgi:hypothetical protein